MNKLRLLYLLFHDIVIGDKWYYIPFWGRIKYFGVSDPRRFRRLNGFTIRTQKGNYIYKWKKIRGNWYKMVDYCYEEQL
jgi:hypothetical protein